MGSNCKNSFPPRIKKYVEMLLTEETFGICAGNIRISDIQTGCLSYTKESSDDRFKLIIPYAGHSVAWEVIMNSVSPEEPPDFIFGADDLGFIPDLENVPSLSSWEPKNPGSLLLVIHELLEEYKKYQTRILKSNSRLTFEYSSLLETQFNEEDIEVDVSMKSENRLGPVKFLIRLPINFSQIPAYLTRDNPGEDTAILLIEFHSPEGSRVSPQLFLSARIEHCLGGSTGLRIPNFPNGGCLMDYVPHVMELLQNKVTSICQGHQKKQEYVSAFLSIFGRAVLEYDTEGYSNMSFLIEWLDFHFIFHIDIPVCFPQDPPIFRFQSIYHEKDNEPYSKEVDNYPYSPRWTGSQMAERAKEYILDFIPHFQRASVAGNSL